MNRKMTAVKTIVKNEFDAAVATHTDFVLMVHVPWCDICKSVAPAFAKLSLQYAAIPFFTAELNENFELVTKTLKAKSYPTFFFYKEGVCKKTVVGANIDDVSSTLAQFNFLT